MEENGNFLQPILTVLKESHRVDFMFFMREFQTLSHSESLQKIKLVSKFLDERGLLDYSTKTSVKIPKNDTISDECRNEGNKLYARNEHIAAVEKYNESLCYAESDRNIGLAYANRSAVCFELQMYSTCVQNIDMAKLHGYPADKLEKLNQRSERCHRLIAEGADSDEKMLTPYGEEYLKLSHPPHPRLPYVAGCLEVKCTDDFGRHIVTNKRLLPGDVVSIESPFFKSLSANCKYKNCINCMENTFLSLIPCQLSSTAMFCSQKCKDEAYAMYYEYKVDVIDDLHRSHQDNPVIHIIAAETFFKSLKICDGNLEKLKAIVEDCQTNPGKTIMEVDDPDNQLTVLKTMFALATHEVDREPMWSFFHSTTIAIIVDLFLRRTKLGEDILKTEDDRDFFRNFLSRHAQVGVVNGHDLDKSVIEHLHNGVHGKSEDGNPKSPMGLFPFTSLINHSCIPNIYQISENGKMYLMVQQVIEPGEQICMSYLSMFDCHDYETRQMMMKRHYFFDCMCEACVKRYPTKDGLKAKIPDSNKSAKHQQLVKILQVSRQMGQVKDIEVELVKDVFGKVRKFLTENQSLYPCTELIDVQRCLKKCVLIFLMSKMAQLSLRSLKK